MKDIDIVCAGDMREALKERSVRGSTAAVCQIDVNNKTLEMKNIDNFSAFHNFRFEVSGVRRMWKAFTVGIGKLIPYDELYITHQKACGLLIGVEEEFSSPWPENQGHLNQAKNIMKIKMNVKGMAALYARSRTVSSHFIA